MFEVRKMKVRMSDEFGNEVIYELYDTELGHGFQRLLPFAVNLQQSGSNERSFTPSRKFDVFDAPLASGGVEALCYHQPWEEVILYYGGYSEYEGLYEIGKPIDGQGAVRYLKNPVYFEEIF
jgi:hypothetical protein